MDGKNRTFHPIIQFTIFACKNFVLAKKTRVMAAAPQSGKPAPAAIKTTDGGKKAPWPITTRYALFLGILSFCVYANTLQNDYALDDWPIVQYNQIVNKGLSGIPEILVTPYWYGNLKNLAEIDEYRPLSLVSFAIEYQLFPGNPLPAHLINVLLFAFCVVLLFKALNHLLSEKSPTMAFITALLFSLHPIHTEVVANIKSRDELLCFLFNPSC